MSKHTPDTLPWGVLVRGMLALAIAMGIGRFAFTPLLPLMLNEGRLTMNAGVDWAMANYIGYFVGAWTAAYFSNDVRQGLVRALLGIGLTTLGMMWAGESRFVLGLLLRGFAGVFSGWALVCTSSWCLGLLTRVGQPTLGAWVYVGVGGGVIFAGLVTFFFAYAPTAYLWGALGSIALIGTLWVASLSPWEVRDKHQALVHAPIARPRVEPPPHEASTMPLILCYGIFGFGYIVVATFLPTMARQVSSPQTFGLAWPVFGLAAVLSIVGAVRYLSAWPRRKLWAWSQGVMALGTLLPMLTSSLGALLLSGICVGGTFMVITSAGLQRVRELFPLNATPMLARMTTAFAVGQILGPVCIRLLGYAGYSDQDSLFGVSACATLLLLMSAVYLGFYPRKTNPIR